MKNESDNTNNPSQQQTEMFEFNLLQLANYLFSHRWWIASGTTICVTLATIWVTFIKQPLYRATVTINIDLMAEEKGASNQFAAPYFVQDQLTANKIGIVEQYFDSQEFKIFLFRTMASDDVPENLKEDLAVLKDELIRRNIDKRDDIADWVHSKLDLKGSSEKSRIDLTGNSNKPALASAVANVGAYTLVEYNRQMLVLRLKNLKNFLNAQTSQAKKELHGLEEQLVALQKQAKIISPEEVRVKVNSLQVDQEARLIEFDRQFASLNSMISDTEADLTYFKRLMQENKPASYMYIEQIQRRLEILRFQKNQETDQKPGVRDVAAQSAKSIDPALDQDISKVIRELSKQLETMGPVSQSPWEYVKKIEAALFELKQKRAQAKSELLAQQDAVTRTNRQFFGLPEALKQMSEVKRNIDLTTSLYTALMTRLQDTQIREAAHANDLIVVSSAEPPGAPSGLGRSKTVMLAIVGGMILSSLPLFLRFVLLPTIRNVKDLQHMGVPIIGSIGWYRGLSVGRVLPIRLQNQLSRILKEAPNSAEANAMRFVRFQLEQALGIRAYQSGQASKLLLVGSVNPNDGRTFMSANLADLFATSGVRTCLIDLDFAKPTLGDFFPDAVSESSPMTDLFPKACNFQMLRVSENLTVLRPAAPIKDTMSEVLETREFESALNALEVLFELIIVDTPPLTGHMEPVISAQYADAFLLVVNQRRTLRNEVEDAIRTLQGSLKLPIFGVMNFTFDEISQARRKHKKVDRVASKGGGQTPPSQPPPQAPPPQTPPTDPMDDFIKAG